jgi:endonuclease/exonuclease/phosphatase family metal-dependent hydrolase
MDRQEILRREVFLLLDSHFIWMGDLNSKRTLQDYRLNPAYAKSMEDVASSIVTLALEYKGESL